MSKNLTLCVGGAEDHALHIPPATIDVAFKDVTYSVRKWAFAGSKTTILKGLSGRFLPGQLTAIMGPSGAGKTSLLNVLSGYRLSGVKGSLPTNGQARCGRTFQRMSCFISQEDLMQPLLSVHEAMVFAATFKLSSTCSTEQRLATVQQVLHVLGLWESRDTHTTELSGGQQKRLSIGLELINNHPVFFLDEPVSGLDNVTAKHCLSLLKKLAQQGRTIVCTIHQPSASLFALFDRVYVVARGVCVYQGSTNGLVPFLQACGLHCPKHYNPADYIIEVCDMEGEGKDRSVVKALSAKMKNGVLSWAENGLEDVFQESKYDALLEEFHAATMMDTCSESSNSTNPDACVGDGLDFTRLRYQRRLAGSAASSWRQFCTLLQRMLLQTYRNQVALRLQLFHHVFCALLLGCVFFNEANDGSKMFNHLKLCTSVVLFHGYTWLIVPVVLFPIEVNIMRREYFNQWYGLSSYYLAYSISKLPSLVFFSVVFLTLVYFMTGLPIEGTRFVLFSLTGVAVAICAEGLGLMVGSLLNVTNGCATAPAVLSPFLGLAVYGLDFAKQIPGMMNTILKFSFLRCGLIAEIITVFGMERKKLDCSEIYCHYSDPKVILQMVDMEHQSVWNEILPLCGILFAFRIFSYMGLRWRLTT